METLWKDIRYAIRVLLKQPGFTAVAVITLALGIGASTAIFSVVHAVLLQPLPYPQPDRVMIVGETLRGGPLGDVSAGNFVDWQQQSTMFEHLAAAQASSFNLATGDAPERVTGARVTARFFPLFGVAPLAGRFFVPGEDTPGQEQVAIISEKLWNRRFQRDPSILGRALKVDGRAYNVVGVMPAWFDPTAEGDELWVPIAFSRERRAMHDEHYLLVFGRLKQGISAAQAQQEWNQIAKVQSEHFPLDNSERGIIFQPLAEVLVSGFRRGLLMLLGAVGFVVLIVCANVANLQLTRARGRRKEIAVRVALGAGPGHILRQLLAESVVLALVGGVFGVLLAAWSVQLLVSSASQAIPRIGEAGINIPVLLFTLALSLGTGVLFGLAPALRSSSVSLSEAFKDGSRGSTVGLSRDRLRSGAAVAQVGLALVLVVGAGLLIRSVMLLQQVDPGFDPSGVLVGRVALPEAHFSNPASARLAFWRLAEDLNALPGVQAAAVASTAPFGGGGSNGLVPEGKALDPRSAIDSMFRLVSPRYFAAMRVPLRRGRVFDGREEFTSPKVMVINETLARRAWPGQDPIGTRFACCEGGPDGGPVWHEVIGVVGDVHAWGIGQDVRAEFYLPLAQAPNDSWNWMQRSMEIVVRSTSQDAVLTSQMRQVVAGVAPGVPLYRVGTMQHRISQSLDQSRFNTFLMSIFAGLALFLAALGIYGVMAYSVTQRNHEIGIRIALGARSWDVLRLIVGQGLWLVLAGIGIGLGGALALTHVLQGMLFGVTSTDPWTFAGASLLLGAVALAACYLPARRATKVDPMVALRYE